MRVAAALASIAAVLSLSATLVAIAAAVALTSCDSALTSEPGSEPEPVALSAVTDEEWAPPRGEGGQGEQKPVVVETCSFLERMEALMRNLSTCWMRDSYVLIVMDIVCPMKSSDGPDDLRHDIEGKLHTLVTCYGLEVLEADGSLWYRWPDVDTRQWAIDVAVGLGAGRAGGGP